MKVENMYLKGKLFHLNSLEYEQRQDLLGFFDFHPDLKAYFNSKNDEQRLFLLNFAGYTMQDIAYWYFKVFSYQDYLNVFDTTDEYHFLNFIETNNINIITMKTEDIKKYLDCLLAYYKIIDAFNQRELYLINNIKTIKKDYQVDKIFYLEYLRNKEWYVFPNQYEDFVHGLKVDARVNINTIAIKIINDDRLTNEDKRLILKSKGMLDFYSFASSALKAKSNRERLVNSDFLIYKYFQQESGFIL